jgi:tRNA wybutosine-synthesizing protein 4
VDVDYRELMITKTSIIKDTEVLNDIAKPRDVSDSQFVMESEQYYAIGCDLRDLPTLEFALRALNDVDEAQVLFVAEVSMTYMNPDAADALIAWARTISEGIIYQSSTVNIRLTRSRRNFRPVGANFARWPRPSICQDNA